MCAHCRPLAPAEIAAAIASTVRSLAPGAAFYPSSLFTAIRNGGAEFYLKTVLTHGLQLHPFVGPRGPFRLVGLTEAFRRTDVAMLCEHCGTLRCVVEVKSNFTRFQPNEFERRVNNARTQLTPHAYADVPSILLYLLSHLVARMPTLTVARHNEYHNLRAGTRYKNFFLDVGEAGQALDNAQGALAEATGVDELLDGAMCLTLDESANDPGAAPTAELYAYPFLLNRDGTYTQLAAP